MNQNCQQGKSLIGFTLKLVCLGEACGNRLNLVTLRTSNLAIRLLVYRRDPANVISLPLLGDRHVNERSVGIRIGDSTAREGNFFFVFGDRYSIGASIRWTGSGGSCLHWSTSWCHRCHSWRDRCLGRRHRCLCRGNRCHSGCTR